jgi:hypothetical protein
MVGAVALLSTLVSVVLAVVLSRPAEKPVTRAAPTPEPALSLAPAPEPAKVPEPARPSTPTPGPDLARPLLPLPAPAPVVAEPPAGSAVGADEGMVEVTLTPAGTVTIDGKNPTPIEGTHTFVVRKGMHEVTVTNSKVIVSWSVYVRPGGTVKKQYAFRGRR